jgi:hypothetical protein
MMDDTPTVSNKFYRGVLFGALLQIVLVFLCWLVYAAWRVK